MPAGKELCDYHGAYFAESEFSVVDGERLHEQNGRFHRTTDGAVVTVRDGRIVGPDSGVNTLDEEAPLDEE